MEQLIVENQRDLNFGLALFVSTLKYNELLLAKHLGIPSFSNLNETQMKAIKHLIVISMDDYPVQQNVTAGNINRRLDGQYTLAEDIVPQAIIDFKKASGVDPLGNYTQQDLDSALRKLRWN